VELTSAFVLHHRPFRETSSLVDVISRDYGRISLVARGIRKQSKRQNNALQLFQPIYLNWSGHGELVTLNQAETIGAAFRLVGKASLCGLYMNELLVKLLPVHEAEPAIYDAYQVALEALHQQDDEQVVLRVFEKQLLSHLGYGLVLNHDIDNQALLDDVYYRYLPESGPERQTNQASEPLISGRSLRILHEQKGFDQASLKEIKILMRTVINFYLGGKPLHSRQLFAGLNQYKKIN